MLIENRPDLQLHISKGTRKDKYERRLSLSFWKTKTRSA
jgi:hypothetical protein